MTFSVFLSLDEAAPGNNIGLVAFKTCSTAIRGQNYAIAAAMGKIGAFVGTFIFPIIQSHAPDGTDSTRRGQDLFFVSSSLCVFSTFLAFSFCLTLGKIPLEDINFREYLENYG